MISFNQLSDFMGMNSPKEIKLKKGFNEYQFLLNIAERASTSWLGRKFHHFDALVGENACQIRAVFITRLATKGTLGFDLLEQAVLRAHKVVSYLLEPKQIRSLDGEKKSLRTLFQERDELRINITKEQGYIILCYLLTVAKKLKYNNEKSLLQRSEVSAPKKLMSIGNISSKAAAQITDCAREIVSSSSVEVMREFAKEIGNRELEELASKAFTVKIVGKESIPYFTTFKIALFIQLKERMPVVLIVQQHFSETNTFGEKVPFFLKVDKEGSRYIEHPIELEDKLNPAIFCEGYTSKKNRDDFKSIDAWKKELSEINFKEMILSYSAAHRQYPDVSLDQKVIEKNVIGFQEYRNKGIVWGCSLENPSRLFFSHMYAATLGHINELNDGQAGDD